MAKSKTNPTVDDYIHYATDWPDETEALRRILLRCGLDEDIKWDLPTYSFDGKNIVVIQGFKSYFALLFLKGGLLSDPDSVLVKTGQNTHAGRQWRFKQVHEIIDSEPILKEYIKEAIEIEKAGLKPVAPKKEEMKMPEELERMLDNMPKFKKAFDALTPGRQRGYIFYFSQPKQSKTREARIEKYMPMIMKGKGMYDEYLEKGKK